MACGAEKRLQTRRRDVRRVWRPATRPGRRDRLRLNYRGKTTDFEIPLRRAVRVTLDVKGDDDKPVAGAVVCLTSWAPDETRAVSDEQGHIEAYVLPGPVQPLAVRIPAPYFRPRQYGNFEMIADTDETKALKSLNFERGKVVSGRVFDEEQRPVAGAEIRGTAKFPTGDLQPIVAVSDKQGEFSIDALPADAATQLRAGKDKAITAGAIAARPGGEPVTLTIRGNDSVALEGRVVDVAGKPVAGAWVRIWTQQNRATGRPGFQNLGSLTFDGSDRLVTDSEGRFGTPRWLRPDLGYSLEVEAPGLLAVETEAIEPAIWQTTRFADVVLPPAPRLRVVSGRVIDSQKKAVEGAVVWQSGDGPRRTETTTDELGRFQLGGIYDGPAFFFVRKEGFRLQGARIGAADKTCEIRLRGDEEPALVMKTVPSAVPLDEQRRLAMSLVEPSMPMLRDHVFRRAHNDLLTIVGRCDPARTLEIAGTILAGQQSVTVAQHAAAAGLAETDVDAALEVVAVLPQPRDRAQVCINAFDLLAGVAREQTDKLLDEALLAARAESDPGIKIYLIGRIAERWLDAGEPERGTALLREGQALAEALHAANKKVPLDNAVFMACRFAGSLARIDGPAAIHLIEQYPEGATRDVVRSGVARGLAGHDAAEAERLVDSIAWDGTRLLYGMAMFHRMGAHDAQRAARLARRFPESSQQAYSLGLVAHSLARKDHEAAARLLEEAYGILERAEKLSLTENRNYNRAMTAAALLPVAEKIGPRLVEGYLWRSLALRAPRPGRGGTDWVKEIHLAHLSALIARYDQTAARDLLEPFAGRWRELAGQAQADDRLPNAVFMAAVIADARWACELVQSVPDAPVEPAQNPHSIVARAMAEWLGRGPRDLWPAVYVNCTLREPNSPDCDW